MVRHIHTCVGVVSRPLESFSSFFSILHILLHMLNSLIIQKLNCYLFGSFAGQGDVLGPHYSVSSHSCNSESQCNQSMGEACLWLYEGCTMGRCMCDPRVHIQDSNGKCRLSKYA